MVQFVGRVTKDAEVATLKDNRQVVNFSLAINDQYKPKGSDTPVKKTLFVRCSYWQSAKVIAVLRKGAVVQVFGRLSVDAYTAHGTGEARGVLNCHVNTLDVLQFAQREFETQEMTVTPETPADDLPF